jgi:hypothetical protein
LIVVIEEAVFASTRTEQVALVSLLRLGFEGRHRVQTDPAWAPGGDSAVHRWLAKQSRDLREEIELAFEYGLEADAHGIPSDLCIRVGDLAEPSWEASPPRLPVTIAVAFLRTPLRLLVENRRFDGGFLQAVAPEPWRRHLKSVLDGRQIELAHGGGLSDMKPRVDEMTGHPEEPLRHWVLFDSDAREPGRPSEPSEALRRACIRAGVAHHQLRRRAAENYLPLSALAAWVSLGHRSERAARRRRVEAFSALSAPQRHHYNMREGFGKDRKDRRQGIPALQAEVAEHPELQEGFGRTVRELFLQESFELREEWLLRDGQREETLPMIEAIFRRL